MTFAAITPALIVGGFAERMRFSAVILFCVLWSTFVYMPMAHMVWYADGLLFVMGALDFAGGTVVHINAGRRGAGRLPDPRAAGRLPARGDAAAQPGDDDGRRRAALGRLVRLQRRLEPRGERRHRARA